MYSAISKVKTNLFNDRRFGFSAHSAIPPRDKLRLRISASAGCSAARIEAALFDKDDVLHSQIGAPEQGPPFVTDKNGNAEWIFCASKCAGGYLKWRIWPSTSGTGPRSYGFTTTIEDDEVAISTASVEGSVAQGPNTDTPILDGVQVSLTVSAPGPVPHETSPSSSFLYAFGSSGEAVGDLQRKLATLNFDAKGAHTPFYAGPCDGFYNRGMENAIKDFKLAHDLKPADKVCDAKTWERIDEEAGSVFAETWQFEFEALRGNHMPAGARPVEESQLIQKVHNAAMAGLAFSGGGVRSATFNLGVLQALGELHLLRHFDYLSTVSGGGYIGAWMSKWLKRMRGDIDRMELKLNPAANPVTGKCEPEEIRFLRQFSNYLTAKTGLFSADTWTVVATYVRNALLNMTMMVACLVCVLVLTRILVVAAGNYVLVGRPAALDPGMLANLAVLAIIAAFWAVFWIAVSISTHPDPAAPKWRHGQSQANIIRRIVLPLMLAALLGSIVLWDARADMLQTWLTLAKPAATWQELAAFDKARRNVAVWLLAPGICYFLVWACGWTLAQYYNQYSSSPAAALSKPTSVTSKLLTKETWHKLVSLFKVGLGHFLCALAALAVGSLLVILTTIALARRTASAAAMAATPSYDGRADPLVMHVLAFGMPLLLALFAITTILSVGLVGRMYSEKSREWWSRQSAWTVIFVIAWLAFISMGLYAPAVLAYAHVNSHGWASAFLGTTWIGTTVSGLLAGIGKGEGKEKHAGPTQQQTVRITGVIIAVTPYVFATGLLMLVSGVVHWCTADAAPARPDDQFLSIVHQYNAQTLSSSVAVLGWTLLASLLIAALLAWRVDINRFSLHMMYRNRLVRAYLGASNVTRHAHPFTGFDEQDDVDFGDLLETDGKIQRPYHIINCALNMVHGQQLAWQTRKAGGFTFTAKFCGFELPSMPAPGGPKIADEALRGCYRHTSSYRPRIVGERTEDSGIKLGMAMAVSGAAVSPNWGSGTTPALAFLMTLFNLRLGRWFANPRRKLARGEHTSPRFGIVPLLSELFGLTDAQSDFVYLSDGGHFEDLAIYELVRRRCRLIVAVDASADGKPDFGDLGNAIRKCATDLHVDIAINVAGIDPLRDTQLSREHCVAGVIDYTKADGPGAPDGILLYIKPSLIGTETAELLNYRKTSAAFPHQSTIDQWFDETQFESYRSLGYQIAKQALADAAKPPAGAAASSAPDILHLCDAIKDQWCRNAVGDPCPTKTQVVSRGPERRCWDAAGEQRQALMDKVRRAPERRHWDAA